VSKPLGLGLAAVALAALAACDEPATPEKTAAPRTVRAIKVGSTDQIGQRTFSGRARAARQVALAFRVPGRVLELPVIVGDNVEEGDVVARLDPAPYLATANRARAELAHAEAAYKNASAQYARVVHLVKKGTFSRAKGDEAKADNDTAAATVTAMQAALEAAELDLQYTTLGAPFPGRIVATYFEKFEEVRPQEPVLRLLDISRVEMVIEIPETLISLIPLVEEVKVVFDAVRRCDPARHGGTGGVPQGASGSHAGIDHRSGGRTCGRRRRPGPGERMGRRCAGGHSIAAAGDDCRHGEPRHPDRIRPRSGGMGRHRRRQQPRRGTGGAAARGIGGPLKFSDEPIREMRRAR
jgi:biotin carboxyl carrier protein